MEQGFGDPREGRKPVPPWEPDETRFYLIQFTHSLFEDERETVQQLGFLIIFPLTFLSNAFVPTATLPGVLQTIAEWNPISALTQATRQLFGNPSPYPSGSFPSEHPYLLSIAWSAAILLAFVPLGIRRYRAIDR